MRETLAVLSIVAFAGFSWTSSSARRADVTLAASRTIVVYGGPVRLSGRASGASEDELVRIVVRRFGEPVFRPIAGVRRGPGGVWRLTVRPAVATSLQARYGDERSAVLSIRVRPRVELSVRSGFFFAKVVAARSFQGRFALFQRRSARGGWISVRKVVLGRPPRRFRAALPAGRSLVRIYLPRGQAGAGYLAGYSRLVATRT